MLVDDNTDNFISKRIIESQNLQKVEVKEFRKNRTRLLERESE